MKTATLQINGKTFNNYYVTDAGQVFNATTNKEMGVHSNGARYYQIALCENGKQSHQLLHRVIYESFNPNYDRTLCIHHIDANPRNCALANLQAIDAQTHLSKDTPSGKERAVRCSKSHNKYHKLVTFTVYDNDSGEILCENKNMTYVSDNKYVSKSALSHYLDKCFSINKFEPYVTRSGYTIYIKVEE